MKHKLVRNLTVIVGLLIIAVFVFGAVGYSRPAVAASPAKQAAAAEDPGVVSARGSAPEWTASSKPWTLERMAAAKPYPLKLSETAHAVSIEPTVADGVPGMMPSNPPAGADVSIVTQEDIDFLSVTAPLGYSYPAPFTRYGNFTTYKRFPFTTIGVLFFTQYGVDYRCSAASIGNYAIWTAGHCVHYGDNSSSGWSYNVVFVPGYANGSAPFGTWTADNLWTLAYWYQYGDLRYDNGGVILNTNGGLSISQRVGNLGFAYNQSQNLAWYAMGYPAAAPFNGKYQTICASSYAYSDTLMGSPYPTGIGCDQTGGTSGGPWIWMFNGNAGATNYLNGNMSYRYVGYSQEIFTPYFGTPSYNLWYALVTDVP